MSREGSDLYQNDLLTVVTSATTKKLKISLNYSVQRPLQGHKSKGGRTQPWTRNETSEIYYAKNRDDINFQQRETYQALREKKFASRTKTV